MTREERRDVLLLMMDFFYCPTTGRIIDGGKGDNKVLCGCGKSNPSCKAECTEQTATHIKRFLRPASVDAYMLQEEARRAKEQP